MKKQPYVAEPEIPSCIHGEQAILGSILLDNALIEQCADLEPDDFFLDSHKRIFLRIKELRTEGKAADIVTLSDRLQTSKEAQEVGGVAYVADLTTGLPYHLAIRDYVGIVKEKSNLRKVATLSEEAREKALDGREKAINIGRDLYRSLEKLFKR